MPVDQDFRKSLHSGSMERKDKHIHGLSVYSWGTNGSFKTKGASVVTLSPSGQSVSLRNSVINLTCHWQVGLSGSSGKMAPSGNLCC